MNKNTLIVGIIAIAVVLCVGLAVLIFLMPSFASKLTKVLENEVSDQQATSDQSLQPYRLLCATSADAINWKACDNQIASRTASLGAMYNGEEMFVYYHKARQLYASVSSDGVTWQEEKVIITGLREGIEPFDPEVVVLGDGRYRMYFYEHPASDPGGGRELTGIFTIGSAISTDGIHFTVEPGTRLSHEHIMGPDAIKMGNVWRMFSNHNSRTISAISYDGGITFEFEKQLQFNGFGTSVVEVKGGYRIFYGSMGSSSIFSSFSEDGVIWQEEGKVTIEGATLLNQQGGLSVAVIHRDGTYWLFYTQRAEGKG